MDEVTNSVCGLSVDEAPEPTVLTGEESAIAAIESSLREPTVGPAERARLLVQLVTAGLGQREVEALADSAAQAVALLPQIEDPELIQQVYACSAGVNALRGHLPLCLEHSIRLSSLPNLSARSKNVIGVVLHRAGAFDLAAEVWADVVNEALGDARPQVVLNLLSSLGRLELTLGPTGNPRKEQHLRAVEQALTDMSGDMGSLGSPEMIGLHRANIAVLSGDLATASELWGKVDSLNLVDHKLVTMYLVMVELRIAIFRDELDRAQELVDYLLTDLPESETIRLAKVEANLRLSEILSRRGHPDQAIKAAATATQLALADRFELPRILFDEIGERMSRQVAEATLVSQMSELRQQLRTDALTGLGNRRAFEALLLSSSEDPHASFAVIAVQIDDIASVAERFGNAAADWAIKQVAGVLLAASGDRDVVARLDGDEFVIVSECSRSAALHIAEAFRESLNDQPWVAEGVGPVRCSVGVAAGTADDRAGVVAAADNALHRSMAEGGDRIVVARQLDASHPADDHASVAPVRDMLLQAIRNPEHLSFVFQPIVPVSGRGAKLEALARWRPPSPEQPDSLTGFLAAVDRFGLGDEFTEVCLEAAAIAVSSFRRNMGPTSRISVNLSSFQMGPRTVELVDAALASTGEVDWLSIEVVEDLNWARLDETARIVNDLQQRGIPVALDDFGTGATNLELMTRVGFDGVKMDARLIAKLRDSPLAMKTIGSYVAACTHTGMEVTAEGVEDAELANRVRLLNFSHVQGFYYGRPVPVPRSAKPASGEGRDGPVPDFNQLRAEIEAIKIDDLTPSLEARLAELDVIDERLGESAAAAPLRCLLLTRRAHLASFGSQLGLAMEYLEECAVLAASIGDTGVQIGALLMQAQFACVDLGSWEAGSDAMARGLQLLRTSSLSAEYRARGQSQIGVIFYELELPAESLEWWERALQTMAWQRGLVTTRCCWNIAETTLSAVEGDYSRWEHFTPEQAALLERAIGHLERSPQQRDDWLVAGPRARFALWQGNQQEAREILDASERSSAPTSVNQQYSRLRALAVYAGAAGDDAEFLARSQDLLDFFAGRGLTFRSFERAALRLMAEAWERNGDFAQASQVFRRVLSDERRLASLRSSARLAWLEAHMDESRVFRL